MGLLSCCGVNKLAEEARLLNDCYPPSKQLVPVPNDDLKASQDSYKPLSQELSRLTYYASNKPGKLNRLGKELEVRAAGEARKASTGNVKSRISFMISLAILRSLLSECKSDVGLFATSTVKILENALDFASKPIAGGGLDLEIAIRAVGVFTSFATYADSAAFAADDATLTSYLAVLRRLAAIAVQPDALKAPIMNEKGARDFEARNRTRLIGLAALSAAVQSDMFHTSLSEFRQQAEIVLPALMQNLWLGDMDDLKLQTARVQMDFSPSPYFSEFSARRPAAQRRAPSLHKHIVGEKGPSTADVIGAALGTLRELLSDCHSSQLADALDVSLTCIDKGFSESASSGWADEERCCWLAESMTRFTMLPYRYAMSSILLERFMSEIQKTPVTQHQMTLLRMLDTIWSAENLSLTGFSPSEALSVLLTAIIARLKLEQQDTLLVPLVNCISSLSTHVYYAGQADDMIEEVLARISELQMAGPRLKRAHSRKESTASGASTPAVVGASPVNPADAETIRILVTCLANILLGNSDVDVDTRQESHHDTGSSVQADKGKGPARVESRASVRKGRRNPVSPEVWQETLPLLCESKFAIRAEYAKALLLYLRQELPAYQSTDSRGASSEIQAPMIRFFHALTATLYSLAITARLGFAGPALALDSLLGKQDVLNDLPSPRVQVEAPTPGLSTPHEAVQPEETPKMTRRTSKLVSLPFNRHHSGSAGSIPGPGQISEDTAGPLDYLIIQEVITTILENSPRAGLLIMAPMLLALDRDAGTILVRKTHDTRENIFITERRRACRELVCHTWVEFAEQCEVNGLSEAIRDTRRNMPEPSMIPQGSMPKASFGLFAPSEMMSFPTLSARGEGSTASRPIAHPELIVSQFSESPMVQRRLSLDRNEISDDLSTPWTVESALANSIELPNVNLLRSTSKRSLNMSPMKGSNYSVESHDGTGGWGVDVEGLREALGAGGRPRSKSQTRSATASMDGSIQGQEGRRMHPDDAKEILKDIFRDRKARASHVSVRA